ncbi:MAG: hypothetical protein KGY54_09480, partial [Oleiphilaceae bacterium]|nr:hypothetical protein [Oleiphilaceae bacterium]
GLRSSQGRALVIAIVVDFLTTIISYSGYYEGLKSANQPDFNLESTMSNKAVKVTSTSAMIADQTAAFLKSGGAVEYVGKGKSGQFASSGSKQVTLKAR